MPKIRELYLEENYFYHIFNRGVNGNITFLENENYLFFLSKAKLHLIPYFEIYAYCLMPNHFHFLVKIKTFEKYETKYVTGLHSDINFPSKQIGKLISSYTQAFNKKYHRHGPLFESPFKRLKISDEGYLKKLLIYIHKNPQNIGIAPNKYRFSSYQAIVSENKSLVSKESLNWFDTLENFKFCHEV
jgi:putative transposase